MTKSLEALEMSSFSLITKITNYTKADLDYIVALWFSSVGWMWSLDAR